MQTGSAIFTLSGRAVKIKEFSRMGFEIAADHHV
jgi:hypothetical protein